MNKYRLLPTTILLLLIALSSVASAALVPCTGGPPGIPGGCTICDFIRLGDNIIKFMIQIAISLGALFFAWGGFVIMTAGGSEDKIKDGRNKITIAVTGIIITLTAWLIVGTVLRIITGSESAIPWNKIECKV